MTLYFHFLGFYTIYKIIKQYFPRKKLKLLNLTIGERPNKKHIESLNLTSKVNILRLSRGKYYLVQFVRRLQKLNYFV